MPIKERFVAPQLPDFAKMTPEELEDWAREELQGRSNLLMNEGRIGGPLAFESVILGPDEIPIITYRFQPFTPCPGFIYPAVILPGSPR